MDHCKHQKFIINESEQCEPTLDVGLLLDHNITHMYRATELSLSLREM